MERREILLAAGAMPLALTGAALGAAAPASGDLRARFDRLLARYMAAWEKSDGAALGALSAPDVHWVNVVGMHWQGKADVDYAHTALFASSFKGRGAKLEEIESLVALPGGAAVAVVRWAVEAYTSPGGHAIPPSRTRMTLVLVPQGNEFLIAHGANITINEGAQASDPVRRRSERPAN